MNTSFRKLPSQLRFALFFGILFFQACRNELAPDSPIPSTVAIDLTDNLPVIDLHEAFSDLELIRLELTEESAIQRLAKLVVIADKLYILDRRTFRTLVFDDKGKFIEKIYNPGRGPGEINRLYDINFNQYTGKLDLMSPTGKLVAYDLDQKTFETVLTLPDEFKAVHHFINISGDVTLFFSKTEPYQLLYYARNRRQVIEKRLPHADPERKIRGGSPFSPFFTFQDQLLFVDPLSNSIYTLDQMECRLRHTVDFGAHDLELSAISGAAAASPEAFREYIMKQEIAFPITSYFENERLLLFSFFFKGDTKTIVYHKPTATHQLVDIPHNQHFIPCIGTLNNQLIGCVLRPEMTAKLKSIIPNYTRRTNHTIHSNNSLHPNHSIHLDILDSGLLLVLNCFSAPILVM